MIDARSLVGRADVVLITLDTLRYDAASQAFKNGQTPALAEILPRSGWERRQSPATFTLPAHLAFFHGFFPTPVSGPHERLFAVRFPGSNTIGPKTAVFDARDIPGGFAARGYRTACIGGTSFFNPAFPLGGVLPSFFSESYWSSEMGVADPDSTRNQVSCAIEILDSTKPGDLFLFINVAAIHQPNSFYAGTADDCLQSHVAALSYVDSQLSPLFRRLRERSPVLLLVLSDHGTCYGEGGYVGHRVAHPVVWDVPYLETVL
jgi:hypothetical protein